MKQALIIGSMAVAIFTSCKKDSTAQEDSTSTTSISKIEHANDYSEISYNTDGSIKSIASKLTNGNLVGTFNFMYDGNKIKQVTFGSTKLNYTYAAGFVTKVETVNGVGTLTHRNEFTYQNTQLIETIDYWPSGTNGLKPLTKTRYNYNAAGNISLTEEFDFVNNVWVKNGEVSIPSYDNKKNTSGNLESFIYLPGINFCINNPLKEEYKDSQGTLQQTVLHVYTYDSKGRPTQRTSTTKVPGLADVVETTKFYY